MTPELQERIDKLKQDAIERKKKQTAEIIDWFENMEPFEGNTERIPLIPVVDEDTYQKYIIPNLIRCGAIPKDKLEVGATYIGDCRNASEAVWKENGRFEYMRTKFGCTYPEEINHFQDDDGYDVFTPIKKLEIDV